MRNQRLLSYITKCSELNSTLDLVDIVSIIKHLLQSCPRVASVKYCQLTKTYKITNSMYTAYSQVKNVQTEELQEHTRWGVCGVWSAFVGVGMCLHHPRIQ